MCDLIGRLFLCNPDPKNNRPIKSHVGIRMMTKRNRNIKIIFIMLQMGTNIMANQVKTPIQNYFEKVLYENLTFEIPKLQRK
jgi:hypothetical protein